MKNSLQIKFIFACLLVIFPFAILLFVVNQYSMDKIRSETVKSNNNLMSMYMSVMDTSLQKMNENLDNIQRNKEELSLVSLYESGSRPYIFSKYKILETLKEVLGYTPQADYIFLYIQKNSDVVSTNHSVEDSAYEGDWRKIIDQAIAGKHFHSWQTLMFENSLSLFSVIEAAPSVYIGAWINARNLMSPFEQMNLGERGQVVALSKNFEPKASMRDPLFLHLPSNFYTNPYPLLDNGKVRLQYVQVSKKSNMTDLILAVLIPEGVLLKNLIFFQRVFYVIILVVFVVLAVYVLLLRFILIRPMNRLIKGMRQLEGGKNNVRLKQDKSIELRQLIDAFNQMSSEIHHLKVGIYEEKNRVLQAEYKHLQAQIKPHFYLNSLNIVYNLIALRKYETSQKLVLHISDYFRFITRNNKELVTINEEINHIRNYMGIQVLRFPDQISVEYDLQPEAMNALIPPLTLQPLVENSVVHGFKNIDMFRIRIRIQIQEDLKGEFNILCITVSDNGVGFSMPVLSMLQNEDYFEKNQDDHLGIWNIFRRLSTLYGTHTLIKFTNGEEGGTQIVIHLPIEMEGV